MSCPNPTSTVTLAPSCAGTATDVTDAKALVPVSVAGVSAVGVKLSVMVSPARFLPVTTIAAALTSPAVVAATVTVRFLAQGGWATNSSLAGVAVTVVPAGSAVASAAAMPSKTPSVSAAAVCAAVHARLAIYPMSATIPGTLVWMVCPRLKL